MKLYDGREKFYQYDTNQKLICEDCAVGEEVHFSNSAHGDAAICLTYDLDGVVVVDVPNLYLMYAVELNVYSMRTEDDGRCTISRHVFGVIPRKKPSDYVYEETEVKSYAELDRRIKKLEENDGAGIDITGAAAGQIPQIAEVDENGEPTKWQPADLPKVYDWAIAKLPFTEAQISNTASGAGFVVNPTNFADGKTYFRYHAGPTSFAWTNPNPQKGAVTITVLGWSQYADKATANGFSTLNIAYADGTTGRLRLVNGQVVTMTTDAGKVLTQIKGNYDHENWVLLDMDVLSIVADYPAPTGTVKSVNGNLPDEDGNVEIDTTEGGIGQDELQAAVNAAIERAKAGLLVFEDSYVDDTANWLTNGYTKVSQTATIGQPSQCTGLDKWGVLFFVAENAANGTGTHMYFPIDGTYKGRIFTRSVTRRVPGEWHLLPTMSDIPTGGGGGGTADHTLGISGAAVGQIARITAVDGDGVPTAWKSVNLPSGGSGGGGGEKWEKINEFTLAENALTVLMDADSEGSAFELSKMRVYMYLPQIKNTSGEDVGSGYADYKINGVGNYTYPSSDWSNSYFTWTIEVTGEYVTVSCTKGDWNKSSKQDVAWHNMVYKREAHGGVIKSFLWSVFDPNNDKPSAMAGASFSVWGVRA